MITKKDIADLKQLNQEMHDEIGACLSVIKMVDEKKRDELINQASNKVREIYSEVNSILKVS